MDNIVEKILSLRSCICAGDAEGIAEILDGCNIYDCNITNAFNIEICSMIEKHRELFMNSTVREACINYSKIGSFGFIGVNNDVLTGLYRILYELVMNKDEYAIQVVEFINELDNSGAIFTNVYISTIIRIAVYVGFDSLVDSMINAFLENNAVFFQFGNDVKLALMKYAFKKGKYDLFDEMYDKFCGKSAAVFCSYFSEKVDAEGMKFINEVFSYISDTGEIQMYLGSMVENILFNGAIQQTSIHELAEQVRLVGESGLRISAVNTIINSFERNRSPEGAELRKALIDLITDDAVLYIQGVSSSVSVAAIQEVLECGKKITVSIDPFNSFNNFELMYSPFLTMECMRPLTKKYPLHYTGSLKDNVFIKKVMEKKTKLPELVISNLCRYNENAAEELAEYLSETGNIRALNFLMQCTEEKK